MIHRGAFIITRACSLLIRPFASSAEQAAKVPKVGWLSDGGRPGVGPYLQEVFVEGLRDLGHVEGQTIIVERRDAGGKIERLVELAADLVKRPVDGIVTDGGSPTKHAANQ